jgi:MFS family permease
MSTLVSTVMMATLVVGPFYLSQALGLETVMVGGVLSIGPLVAALNGVPAGRLVDRFGAQRITIAGLIGIAIGCSALSFVPARFGIAGYITPIVCITASYALFQTANNTAIMLDINPDQRGVISGLLNLSRNLGLITGASGMGAVFAIAVATIDITTASPEAVATGMRSTFAVAAMLMVVAMTIGTYRHRLGDRECP